MKLRDNFGEKRKEKMVLRCLRRPHNWKIGYFTSLTGRNGYEMYQLKKEKATFFISGCQICKSRFNDFYHARTSGTRHKEVFPNGIGLKFKDSSMISSAEHSTKIIVNWFEDLMRPRQLTA